MTLRPEQLVDLLALAPAGLTAGEVGARLMQRGAAGRPPDVARALDDLRRTGRVTIGPDRRWRLIGRGAGPATSPPGEPAAPGMTAAPARFSLAAAEAMDAEATAPADGAPPPLRELLRYYEQTLRRDARGAIAQRPDDHGARFLLFAGEGAWFPEAERAAHLRIPRAALPEAFREALARAATPIALCVGWPLQVFVERDEALVAPALTLAAEARLDEAGLSVTIPPEEAALNVEWLRRAAKRAQLGAEALTDRLYGGEPSLHAAALAEFGRRAGDLMARSVTGPLDPARLATSLAVSEQKLCNAAALFLPSDTPYTKAAADDLARLAQLPEATLAATALGPLLRDDARPDGAQRRLIPAAALTENQFEAAAAALTEPLTVITGPPGTGKSQVILAVIVSAIASGMSVLFASRNHQAIDAVEERLAAICGEQAAMTRARDAEGERDLNFSGAAKAIVSDASAPGRDVSAALAKLDALAARRDAALAQATQRRALNLDLSALADRLAALDLALPGTVAAAARRGLMARLLGWLRRRGRRETAAALPGPGATRAELDAATTRLHAALAALPPAETDDEAVRLSGEIVADMAALLPALLAARGSPTDEERQSLNGWLRDGELTGRRKPSDMTEDTARAVLRRRGVWAVSTLSAPSRIPAVPGLFDLVLFDEASQCDIASALPLFARARTAAVVGDPAQLGVIPSLGVGQDRELMRGLGLQRPGVGRYAQSLNSLFDLATASSAARRTMLRDQFRSAPEIVDYINEAFYGLRLRTRVDTARLRPPKGRSPGISWTDVRGPLVNETGRGCGSPAEAQAIAQRIAELGQQGYDGEVGVVAPFQQQVMLINCAVQAAVAPDAVERMKLKIATVDAFQGGERDVILFSLTGGADMPPGARRFLTADRRRFNVAVSRARAVCDVFGDLAFARSSGVAYLERLAARSEPRPSSSPLAFDSPWEERLHSALVAHGLEPHPQFEIAGRRLDFALFAESVKLDVEVDGRAFHMGVGGERKASDLWRDFELRGLGWRVRRFWVHELRADMEKCVELVRQDLGHEL